MVADVVYATEGSEDGSAEGAVPLQAQIISSDGQEISETTLYVYISYTIECANVPLQLCSFGLPRSLCQ